MATRHLEYRPDLDGLRALAILPVLFFHTGLGWFPGGFVGVDVFFVLSGFFMARVIMADLDRNAFRFAQFYLRRIRRILPALFTMIAASAVTAWFVLMPKEFRYFAESVEASALFTANLLFERQSGYFDLAAEVKPLLHTWSLSIEEQFYIVFPVTLFLVHRYARRHLTTILGAALLASFGASVWMVMHAPQKAFYLLHFRVWELLLGSLVAVLPQASYRAGQSRFLALIGLAGIFAAVFFYSSETPFPGAHALLPCLGTALVIHAGSRDGWPHLLLANPLSVAIGRLSYSLYLWHWPLIVFFRYRTGHDVTTADRLKIIALSFALAYLSWRFVERPARYGAWAASPRLVLGLTGGAILTAVAFGAVVDHLDGIPQRLTPEAQRLYAATEDKSPFFSEDCFAGSNGEGLAIGSIAQGKLCLVGTRDSGRTTFLIWGDSHAAAIAPAIDKAAREENLSGQFVGRASCPPLVDADFAQQEIVDRCRMYNEAVLALIERQRFPLVFLAGYWPKYVHRAELPGGGVYFDPAVAPENADWSAPVTASLRRTIATLARQGTRVVLVMDVPEMGRNVPKRWHGLR